MIDHTSATLGAHGARLDQLDRDHAETRRRMDQLADTVQRGDQRLADRMDAVTKEMREGFAAISSRLDALTPETISVSIGRGRMRWNSAILAGICISIVLALAEKAGVNTAPMREAISISDAVGQQPSPSRVPIDGNDELRGTGP